MKGQGIALAAAAILTACLSGCSGPEEHRHEIVYVEGMRDHQYIVMEDGERVDVRMTLGELEEKLLQFDIVRTHKSFLVNLKYVRRIDVSEIVLSNDQMVLLSRSKSREIKDIYLKYLRKVGSVMFTE